MKVLHIEIKNCFECPYMTLDPTELCDVYDLDCRKMDEGIIKSHDPRTMRMSDVPIPEWCPLDSADNGMEVAV